jgi:peptidoglycan/xylan/chitin deacetylase (PgdA/CDA1 family)
VARRTPAVAAVGLAAALALSSCASAGTTRADASAESGLASSTTASATGAPEASSPEAGASEHTEGALPGSGSASATPSEASTATGEPGATGDPTASGTPGHASHTAPASSATQTPDPQDTVAPTAPAQSIKGGVDCSKVPCVALTFDDGPGRYTQQILDALTAAKAKATFFLIGTQIKAYPQLVKAEVAAGMQLGNHTWDHADLTRLTHAQQLAELTKVDRELAGLVGVTPVFLRPPGGALDKAEKLALKRPIADWSVDTEDWRTRNTAQTIKVASSAKPGDIVLMHDIHASTAAAVPQIVKNLQAKGYHLVTLTELIGQHPTLGIAYGWGQKPGGPKHS